MENALVDYTRIFLREPPNPQSMLTHPIFGIYDNYILPQSTLPKDASIQVSTFQADRF